jgi:nucleoid-associated protein YejK
MATKEIKLDEKQKQSIVDQVIEQIKKDLQMGDETAIDELLKFVPDEYLIGFLPDDDQPRYY